MSNYDSHYTNPADRGFGSHPGAGNNPYSNLPNGKRPQQSLNAKSPCPKITRHTVDFNSSLVRHTYSRYLHRSPKDHDILLYHNDYESDIPAVSFEVESNPSYGMTTKFAEFVKNKVATVINCVRWTPQGRRIILGCHSGELLLWNGFFFNFELRTQCHDHSVRAMEWTKSGSLLVTADEAGIIKYVEPSFNVVHTNTFKTDPIRSLAFSPDDSKFAVACDDGTLSFLDFSTSLSESSFNPHGSDVKAVSWHPQQALVLTAGKDKSISINDPRTATSVATIHGAHRLALTDIKWAPYQTSTNGAVLGQGTGSGTGYMFATASRDTFAKLWDIRMLQPLVALRGHSKHVNAVEWHPHTDSILASASDDGKIIFWCTRTGNILSEIPNAHEMPIWDLQFHPLGHSLATGSSDQTCKFWTQNPPGSPVTDRNIIHHATHRKTNQASSSIPFQTVLTQPQQSPQPIQS